MGNFLETDDLKQKLCGCNLYLVGMMGSGKTSTGIPLAKALSYGLIDLDSVIEEWASKSISEIFETEGEEGFREIESQILKVVGQRHSLVVSTGGGAVIKKDNWGILHQGIVIWLDTDIKILLKRFELDSSKRPLLEVSNPREVLEKLISARKELYQLADIHIKVSDETAEDLASQIIQSLPKILTN